MKIRSIVAALLAGLLLLALLPSSLANEAEVSGHIVFVTNRTDLDEYFEEMSAQFNAMYPNATVEIQPNGDMTNNLKIMANTNELPDVFCWNTAVFPRGTALSDYLLPLDDMGYTDDSILFYDETAYIYDGQHFGLNEGAVVTGFLARKQTLAEYDIKYPTTTDELYAALEKFKAGGLTPMASMLRSAWPLGNWHAVGMANGECAWYSEMIKQDAPFTMDCPVAKTMQYVRALVDKGFFEEDMISSDWDVIRNQMDRFGMIYLANYGIGALGDVNGPLLPENDEVAFFPLPIDNKGTTISMMSGSWALGASKDTKYPEAAKAFIKFYLEDAGYADQIGLMPSVKAAGSSNPAMNAFMATNPVFFDQTAYPSEVAEIMEEIFNHGQFSTGEMLVEAMLSESGDLQPILDKYNQLWGDAKAALGY